MRICTTFFATVVFIHFQADIATAHDVEKYRLSVEKYQAKKYVTPVFFFVGVGGRGE